MFMEHMEHMKHMDHIEYNTYNLYLPSKPISPDLATGKCPHRVVKELSKPHTECSRQRHNNAVPAIR